LLTQADVGRLDPHEAIAWNEWWYPIRGLGGFTYANRNVAVHAAIENGRLRLRLAATGAWEQALIVARQTGQVLATNQVSLSPDGAVEFLLERLDPSEPSSIEVRAGADLLAEFDVPLSLPRRLRPEPESDAQTASEFARTGLDHYLFARFPEAEAQFKKALELDPRSVEAHSGLAFLNLGRDDARAADEARAALRTNPDDGSARYALAVVLLRQGDEQGALDAAWLAALDPKSAVAAGVLLGRILVGREAYAAAIDALSAAGPWQGDPEAVNLLAVACLAQGRADEAVERARANLSVDPLDGFARSILWLAVAETPGLSLESLMRDDPNRLLDLVVDYVRVRQMKTALRLMDEFHLRRVPERERDPMLMYWAAWLGAQLGKPTDGLRVADALPSAGVFPHRPESERVLRWAIESRPADGKAALYLGHLLFALGRHGEGRAMWERAAELGIERAMAWRALGMASRTLDHDTPGAAEWLGKARDTDPSDAIIARDYAQVLFELADREDSANRKRELTTRALEVLRMAFDQGKGRSDFVALLARAQNRLGQHAETARLLDSVRITIWEGARESHDLFEEAHVALGKNHLESGQAGEALREFDRALEYPENLATGRLDTTREAQVQYLRGLALDALGRKDAALHAWRKAANEPESGDTRNVEGRRLAQQALQTAKAAGAAPDGE
jgi:tetratricopeptide (TPR) repeat protein